MKELKAETIGMCVSCVMLFIVGIITAYIEGPKFHHGLMIASGLMMVLVAVWRYEALSKKVGK